MSNANIGPLAQSPSNLISNTGLALQPQIGSEVGDNIPQHKMDTSTWGSFTGSFFQASELRAGTEGSSLSSPDGMNVNYGTLVCVPHSICQEQIG